MYSALIRVKGGDEGTISVYTLNIKRLINNFIREDRIVYVIQLHRYREIHRLLKDLRDELTPKERGKLEKLARRTESIMKITPAWLDYGYRLTMDNLTHYITTALQNDYHEVLNYTWELNISPSALSEQLSLLESTAIDKARGKDLPLKSGRILLNFPDGYYWVMLGVGKCELEGKAMAHCGNIGDDPYQRILSLRKEDTNGKPKAHLTFIWHQVPYPGEASVPWPSAPQVTQGFLGETKGYANNKPAVKYHPHIIELLKLPMIQFNVGGGYQPENNFSLNDLTKQQRERLYLEKPQLFGLPEFFRVYGMQTSTIFLSALTGINDAPLKERTPHLPIMDMGGTPVVVLGEDANPHPKPVSGYLIQGLEQLGFDKFADGLEQIIEWAEKSTSCHPKDPDDDYVSAVDKTQDLGDDDYDDLPHIPDWPDIHFEEYLLGLRDQHPDTFRFYAEALGTADIELAAQTLREHPWTWVGEEFFDAFKLFYPSEDAGVRWGYLRQLDYTETSTGAALELDFDKQSLLLFITWENFLAIATEKLSDPDAYPDWTDTALFAGTLPTPEEPDGPIHIPPEPESIRCLAIILEDIRITVEKRAAEERRQALGRREEDYRKWLDLDDTEEDVQRGWGDEEGEKENFDVGGYLGDEDEDDEDDDIDLWT